MKLFFLLTTFISLAANAQSRDELLNDLNILYSSGQFDKALPIAKKVLDLTKKELGSDHIQYARSLNDLASIYYSLDDFESALPLTLSAAAIRKKILGDADPLYAET